MAVAVNLRTVDLRSKDFDSVSANRLVPRAAIDITKAVEQIIPLLEDVRTNGQDAVVKVPKSEMELTQGPSGFRVKNSSRHCQI